mmetsp:Transcript_27875/g.70982  ORF Transcript_27875/g.70982 Transcript_27875/m.70982 type:complete len:493 (-) Transcript_27875:1-1479(-)
MFPVVKTFRPVQNTVGTLLRSTAAIQAARLSRSLHLSEKKQQHVKATRPTLSSGSVQAGVGSARHEDKEVTKKLLINFDNVEKAFSDKTTFEIVRALAVFKICGIKAVVRNADKLYSLASSVLGQSLANTLVRNTFFAHFCAGESEDGVRPTAIRLRKAGVGGILDYAAESDVEEEVPSNAMLNSMATETQARLYDYNNEDECDRNVRIFQQCIDAVHNVTPEGFAAVKVTALGNPKLLEHMSDILSELRSTFKEFDSQGVGSVNFEQFESKMKVQQSEDLQLSSQQLRSIFDLFDSDKDGVINYLDWEKKFSWSDMAAFRGIMTKDSIWTDEDKTMADRLFERVSIVADYAAKKDVRLMIDAEHTYFQPVIDHLVLDLQKRYNKASPIIFNTYQCYLKDSYERLVTDLARAEREGYFFAAKLVRGAYLVIERERAKAKGYASPIHDTIADTHTNYHKCVDTVLQNIERSSVMVASHNQKSIEFTVEKNEQL